MISQTGHHPMWVSIPGMAEFKNIRALFTTRCGGVSPFPYDSLNLSFRRADTQDNVIENYRRLSVETGIALGRMVLARQVHGSRVVVVDKGNRGMGLTKEHTLGETDGLVTAEKGVVLVTSHADCVPVYLYDRIENVIGLVHSGWRGTLLSIATAAVDIMKERFHCRAENITAAFGPHIRRCCFEVDTEVYLQFKMAFPEETNHMEFHSGKWRIDLSGIITQDLMKAGLTGENIHDIKRCTECEKETFFSHRGGEGNTGTGAALFMINE